MSTESILVLAIGSTLARMGIGWGYYSDDGVGRVAGFSLHAGVAARADEHKKLERLCRYISRPAVSEKRFSLTHLFG